MVSWSKIVILYFQKIFMVFKYFESVFLKFWRGNPNYGKIVFTKPQFNWFIVPFTFVSTESVLGWVSSVQPWLGW